MLIKLTFSAFFSIIFRVCHSFLHFICGVNFFKNEKRTFTPILWPMYISGQCCYTCNRRKTGGVPSEGDQPNPRSIECELTASIDDQVITVSFSDLTASQIVVRDSANLTVYNQTFASAFSAQADLTSLTNGIYALYIYAMGYWWYGQFEIE